ncbi:MAG TPA: hypothetical protein VIO58_15505 [Candidatus Methanoperedens sp.]
MTEKAIEKITGLFLITLGLISMIISILHIFLKDFEILPVLRDSSQITLLLVGLLCLSFGLERLAMFEDMRKEIGKKLTEVNGRLTDHIKTMTEHNNEIRQSLASAVNAQFVEGYDDIFKDSIKLVQEARETIRATDFAKSKITVTEDYLKELAKKLKESKESKREVVYKCVFGCETSNEIEDRLKLRERIFRDAGVDDQVMSHQVKYSCIDVKETLDLLIIDDKHLMIAFPIKQADDTVRGSLKFVNKPDLVKRVCSWYDEYLWEKGKKIV